MPHRQFTDQGDIMWEVWDVHPLDAARKLAGMEREEYLARRSRRSVAEELASGWLCFESTAGKRRLSPIPEQWERLTDEQLVELCCRASRAPAKRVG